jgi:hypothetical protein
MQAKYMKHSATIWEGEVGASRCIQTVHWEGDISRQQLANVAQQISADWQTIDLQLDPSHPRHGQTFQLRRASSDEYEEAQYLERKAAFEARYAGRRVWVHGFHYEEDLANGSSEPFYYDQMISTLFITLEDIEALCDKHYGAGVWDEFALYLDDELPTPLAIDF